MHGAHTNKPLSFASFFVVAVARIESHSDEFIFFSSILSVIVVAGVGVTDAWLLVPYFRIIIAEEYNE